VVHVNAEFANQVSDHDPQVVDIKPGQQAHAASPRAGRGVPPPHTPPPPPPPPPPRGGGGGPPPPPRAAFVRVLSNTRG
jgi:hypothetical protein